MRELANGSQNTADTFLPRGLCPSSARCWEPPFPGELLGQLPHSRLESVPISPSQCDSRHPHTPDPSCPTLPFLFFYSTYHLQTYHLVYLLIMLWMIFCPPTTTTAPHHHHPLPNSDCGRSGIFNVSFTGVSQALRTVSGTW